MIYYTRLRSRSAIICAGIVTLAATLPAYAQLGQSELISPGGPDQATIDASGGDWANGANPGPGWTPSGQPQYSPQLVRPGARFGGAPQQQAYQSAAPQQMMQQAAQQVTQQQMDGYGDQAMGWVDSPRRQQQQQQMQMQQMQSAPTQPQQALGQSELITPSGAFQSAGGGGAPWEMQTAQEEMQQPQQMMPLPQQKAVAKAARPAANSLSGQVSQTAGMQPVSQFNPNSMMGGGGNPMAAMMGAMGGGMNANPMQASMGGSGAAVNPMGAMMGGGAAANPMGAMMGGGAAANPMGAMMGGMGGMGALGAIGGAMMGGGGTGGSPLDGIGRAISTAAQMGLVPAAKGSQPNIPMGAIDPNNLPPAALQGAGQGGGNYMTPTGTLTQQPIQQQRVQQRPRKPVAQNGIVRNIERRAGQMGNMLMYNAAARGMSSMMTHW